MGFSGDGPVEFHLLDREAEPTTTQRETLARALDLPPITGGRSVMISGYPNRLYDRVALPDWNRHDFPIDNKASGAKTKPRMIESVWCNF